MLQEVFVPGRLCVLGEHSDWAAEYRDRNGAVAYGMTVVCATNEGLYATCGQYRPGTLRFSSASTAGEVRLMEFPMDFDSLNQTAVENGFFCYVAGTAAALLKRYPVCGLSQPGIDINNYKTTLPMGKGLSSSAAVCVLVVQCFSVVFGLDISVNECMELAYRGEMLTASKCGRMDQCVAMGPGRIGCMEFDRTDCHLQLLSCKTPLYFVVADLNRGKCTVEILRSLSACFPFPLDETACLMHHYVAENQMLATAACVAIEGGHVTALAETMTRFQRLFDRTATVVCPSQLSSPRLHEVLDDPRVPGLSLAGKGVGSQGDGSVQFLCRDSDMQAKLLELVNGELGCSGFVLTIPAYDAADGELRRRVPDDYNLFLSRPVEAVLFYTNTTDGQLLPVPDFLLESFDVGSVACADLSENPLLGLLLEMASCGFEKICVIACGEVTPVEASTRTGASAGVGKATTEGYNRMLMGMLQDRVRVISLGESDSKSFGDAFSCATADITGSPLLICNQTHGLDSSPLRSSHLYALNPSVHNTVFLEASTATRRLTEHSIIARDVGAAHSDLDRRTDTLFGLHQFLRSSLLVHDLHHKEGCAELSVPDVCAVIAVSPVSGDFDDPTTGESAGAHWRSKEEGCGSMFSTYRVMDAAIVPSIETVVRVLGGGRASGAAEARHVIHRQLLRALKVA